MWFEIHSLNCFKVILSGSNSVACCNFENGPVQKVALEKSGWLKHIKSILKGTELIVKGVDTDCINVLIHCR